MRLAPATLLLALMLPVNAGAGEGESPFKHDWRFENNGTRLVSNHAAPVPFSTSGEPEATLETEASRVPEGVPPSLAAVVDEEVRGIRDQLVLAEYLEEDGHKPVRDIATWFETIGGERVAFIKYRVAGTQARALGVPRTVIHTIAIKPGYILYSHLTVIFAAHQDEVREDQRRMMEFMLPLFPPKTKR